MAEAVDELLAVLQEKPGSEPVYVRIRDHVAQLVRQGRLKPGDRLPTVRQLADKLSINPMTAARAYRQLSDAGLIEGRGGAGTFVCERPTSEQPAGAAATRPAALIDETGGAGTLSARLFELAQAPGVISFTTNYPEIAHSEVAGLKRCIAELATGPEADDYFRYDPPAGREDLRQALVGFAAEHAIATSARNIVVTSGGQQAIDLAIRTVVNPGDRVIVERPTYFGMLNVLRNARAELLEIDSGPEGPDLGRLEEMIVRHKPVMLCLNPNFQNPTGNTISIDRRRVIVALARQHRVVLVEDDPYPEMRFRGDAVPTLTALASPGDEVFYCRGFGKMFLPGVRLGFAIVPDRWLARYLALKASTDLQSNAFMQGATARWLGQDTWRQAARSISAFYGMRQARLVELLGSHLPSGVHLAVPDGGLNLWMQLPPHATTTDLYFRAARHGVAFAASDPFYAHKPHLRGLRISFGRIDEQAIERGAERLLMLVSDLCEGPKAETSWFV